MMQNKMLHKSYSYKYLDNKKPVYVITSSCKQGKIKPKLIRHYEILSDYYQSQSTEDGRNAIVGYVNESMFKYRLNTIQENIPSAISQEISLQELKDHCESLNMPLIVYVNNYCILNDPIEDHYEIYYYYKQDDMVQTSLEQFKRNMKK
jgi:hypothetical protein